MHPIVLISGLSLTLGCARHDAPAPGPAGTPVNDPPPPMRTSNPPPPPLPDAPPAWDDVPSPHPPGATNPPMPVLAVNSDGTSCYKEWYDPRAVPREALQNGGRIIADGEEVRGTEIACPADRVQKILDAAGGDDTP